MLELGLEVGRALAFAHAQGLVHRDVKPQNVLLNADGLAKVTDFGIVRSLDAVGQTETGTVLGTSHYIAPEQARGERVDAHTDVYSFGVVLYELLAGDVPYPGESFLTVAMKHVNEPVPNVLERRPDAPLRLASLIERCMAKVPGERPASMDDVVSELESVLVEFDAKDGGEATMIIRPKAAPKPTRAPRQRGTRRPFPVWAVLVGVLLLAAVVGGILLAGRDGDNARRGRRRYREAAGGRLVRPAEGGTARSTASASGDATDGDSATYWTTERYRLVLEARRRPRARRGRGA